MQLSTNCKGLEAGGERGYQNEDLNEFLCQYECMNVVCR